MKVVTTFFYGLTFVSMCAFVGFLVAHEPSTWAPMLVVLFVFGVWGIFDVYHLWKDD